MKFEEAFVLARQGIKIRPVGAEQEEYFYLDPDDNFIGEDGVIIGALTTVALLDEWEVYEEMVEIDLEDLEEKIYCMDSEYNDRLNKVEESIAHVSLAITNLQKKARLLEKK